MKRPSRWCITLFRVPPYSELVDTASTIICHHRTGLCRLWPGMDDSATIDEMLIGLGKLPPLLADDGGEIQGRLCSRLHKPSTKFDEVDDAELRVDATWADCPAIRLPPFSHSLTSILLVKDRTMVVHHIIR